MDEAAERHEAGVATMAMLAKQFRGIDYVILEIASLLMWKKFAPPFFFKIYVPK